MKGFPNQVADLKKLANGLAVAAAILRKGESPRDDGVFGAELVRAGIAGTGHSPRPIEKYINEQRKKPVGSQSMRTTARGLRQLYRALGLIDDAHGFALTPLGLRGAATANAGDAGAFQSFWRDTIESIVVSDADGTSHPYQVLLRLVARRPGITRAKCALALVAKDDSPQELEKILKLSGLDEDQIKQKLGVSNSNWDNAKKILPSFAEQLGDVIKRGDAFYLADAPGKAEPRKKAKEADANAKDKKVRRPRTSRSVTPDTIGAAGLSEADEPPVPPELDPKAMAAAIALRADRLKRHNLLVRKVAKLLLSEELYEDPFDILAIGDQGGILVEVKTLNGEVDDERNRVRDALAQLLYYEAFVTDPFTQSAPLKIGAFERRPSDGHIGWLRKQGIICVWETKRSLACCKNDHEALAPFFSELEHA